MGVMQRLRNLIRLRGHVLLAMVIAALGMNALVPAGYMIAPSGSHGIAVTLCPKSNPLAQLAQAGGASDPAAHHAGMDHASVDHAAMGHGSADDPDEAPAAGQPKFDCAFSALAGAATLPEALALETIAVAYTRALFAKPSAPDIAPRPFVQPPLRGPPAFI